MQSNVVNTNFDVPFVEFRHNDRISRVTTGGLIGRSSRADFQLPEPSVSEAHAMVSLRGSALRLLALRRRVTVEGKREKTVELAPGMSISLSSTVTITVTQVSLPASSLELTGLNGGPIELTGSVLSIAPAPEGGLVAIHRYQPDAYAYIWSNSDGLKISLGDDDPFPVQAGMCWTIGGILVSVEQRRTPTGVATTKQMTGFDREKLRLIGRYESVHIFKGDRSRPIVITGRPANLLSLLIEFKAPVRWEMLAREIWGENKALPQLQEVYHVTLRRLRVRLRAEGLPPDLVRPDGRGNVELNLYAGDEALDEG